MAYIVPPREVFEIPPQSATDRLHQGGYSISGFKMVTRSPEGGMLSHYTGHPVPRKGLQYPEGVMKTNQVKRITLTMFSSFAGLKRGIKSFLNSYLENYCRLVDSVYFTCDRIPYMKKEFYCSTSKGMWDLSSVFLKGIGVKQETAEHLGKILATIFEFDDSYRLPIVDVMSEFTKKEILDSPRKFVKKFIYILTERSRNEINHRPNDEFIKRFTEIFALLRFALFIPKVRRAFKKAFKKVDLKLLQYDEYDEYWSLPKEGYNYKGIDSNTRMGKFKEMVKEHEQKRTDSPTNENIPVTGGSDISSLPA